MPAGPGWLDIFRFLDFFNGISRYSGMPHSFGVLLVQYGCWTAFRELDALVSVSRYMLLTHLDGHILVRRSLLIVLHGLVLERSLVIQAHLD